MPEAQIATESALKRLKVLQSLDNLGAGFTLASHDLDMRGGGNPLGEEQSGHIKDLGVELYQHMLEEAVAELKDDDENNLRDESWTPQVNVGVAILIPDTYIPDLNLRLATYRRISEIADDTQANALAAELIDRFGAIPQEVEHLLKVKNSGWRLRPDQTILVLGNYSEPKFRLRGTEKAVEALVASGA